MRARGLRVARWDEWQQTDWVTKGVDEGAWFHTARKRVRWLVGVSGGADSVALLHLLKEHGFKKLVVCHLDHRLRGRRSTEDARFVARLAKDLGLECEIGREDVKVRMEARGQSMETAARQARLEFFQSCARKWRCRRLLLAHHMDDQAETVLWNLLRGSHGLKGMHEKTTLKPGGGAELEVVRPLLGVRHGELVAWLRERKLRWREDESNSKAIAVRNRLRNEAIPLLEEITGRDAVAALCRAADDHAEWERIENEALNAVRWQDPQSRIYLPAFRNLTPNLQRLAMHRFLRQHEIPDVDRALLERAVSLADVGQPAVINLPGGRRLRRTGGRIWTE